MSGQRWLATGLAVETLGETCQTEMHLLRCAAAGIPAIPGNSGVNPEISLVLVRSWRATHLRTFCTGARGRITVAERTGESSIVAKLVRRPVCGLAVTLLASSPSLPEPNRVVHSSSIGKTGIGSLCWGAAIGSVPSGPSGNGLQRAHSTICGLLEDRLDLGLQNPHQHADDAGR